MEIVDKILVDGTPKIFIMNHDVWRVQNECQGQDGLKKFWRKVLVDTSNKTIRDN